MKLYVSRQRHWPDGDLTVEIVKGGLNYANPGHLEIKWSSIGEGEEFTDPREAVQAAINIANEWRKIEKENEIEITFGSTGGMSIPLPAYSDEELIKIAEEEYEKLPKCAKCGELFENEKYRLEFSGDEFCTEYCTESFDSENLELNN